MAARPPPPKRDATGHWKKARFSLAAVRALGQAEASAPQHEPEPEPEPDAESESDAESEAETAEEFELSMAPLRVALTPQPPTTLGTLTGPLCTIQGQAYTDVQPSAPAEKQTTAEELVLELRTAAMAGDQAWVERLLQRGVDADEPDGNGWTPLHWAVSNGVIGSATALLRGGADANRKNDSGSSPLFWAAGTEMARLLLVYGASPGLTDADGNTAEAWNLLMGREAIAKTIRMLQNPKFALVEADKCFEEGEFWIAMRLCEMGEKIYSVYDGKRLKEELSSLRRMSMSSMGSDDSSTASDSWRPETGAGKYTSIAPHSLIPGNISDRLLVITVTGSMGSLAMQASMQSAVIGHLGFGTDGTATADMQTAAAKPGAVAAARSAAAVAAAAAAPPKKLMQYGGVYWAKRGKGGAVLVHGEGIYRHRDALKKAGGSFEQILHGWVFTPAPGMRYETHAALVAMIEEKFNVTERDRMRSFIEPPKKRPQVITERSESEYGSSEYGSEYESGYSDDEAGSAHADKQSLGVVADDEASEYESSDSEEGEGEEEDGIVGFALYDWQADAAGQCSVTLGAKYRVSQVLHAIPTAP